MKCLTHFSFFLIRLPFTPIKKILSFLLFPLVYPLRYTIWRSTNAYTETRWEIEKVVKYNKGIKLFIWFFFDDSIYSDYGVDFHPTKHKSRLVELLCKYIFRENKTICNFLRSWYWAGWRNSSNNLSHYLAEVWIGKYKGLAKNCIKNKYITYEIRKFTYTERPYLEIRFRIGKRKCYANIGWLKSGKFEGIKLRCKNET